MLLAFTLGAALTLAYLLQICHERARRREIFTIARRLAERNQQLELLVLRLRQELTDRPQDQPSPPYAWWEDRDE